MFISTTETVPGMNYQILGVVQGNTVQSKDFVSDFKQGFKSIVGGKLYRNDEYCKRCCSRQNG